MVPMLGGNRVVSACHRSWFRISLAGKVIAEWHGRKGSGVGGLGRRVRKRAPRGVKQVVSW